MDIFESKEKKILNNIFNNLRNYDKNLCMTMASQGSRYGIGSNKKIMVVGRAVNGWEKTKFDNKEFDSVYDEVIKCFKNKEKSDPMDWVNKAWKRNEKNRYNTARSAFWRVIRRFVIKHTDDSPDWASKIVWTNLYKISPVASGNPSDKLKDEQLDQCVQLLKLEIDFYDPDIILFITDNWFNKFAEVFDQKIRVNKNEFGVFEIDKRKIIITPRPETIKQKEWLKNVGIE